VAKVMVKDKKGQLKNCPLSVLVFDYFSFLMIVDQSVNPHWPFSRGDAMAV
jgi:hypothetical protein